MRKRLKGKILSSLTALAVSASVGLGAFPAADLVVSAQEEIGNGIFSLTEAELNALRDNRQYTNNLSAAISFQNIDGSTSTDSVSSGYFLVVHVVGKNSNSFTYSEGDDNDYYKVFSLSNNGGSWNSGSFNIVPATQSGFNQWSSPDAESLEGYIVKDSWNNADSLVARITGDPQYSWATNTYSVTNMIDDFKVTCDTVPSVTTNNSVFRVTATKAEIVNVNVLDYEGNPSVVESDSSTRYFVLGYLVDSTADDKSYSGPNVKAWSIDEIDLTNNTSVTAGFTKFHPFGTDGSDTTAALVTPGQGEEIRYRVFSTGGSTLATLKDCKPSDANKIYDGIPDYIPSSSTEGGVTNITFKKNKVEYHLVLDFDEAPDFTAEDNIYVYAKATHSSGNTYYSAKLADITGTTLDLVLQDSDTNEWKDQNNNQGQRYHGSASESVTVNLVQASQDVTVSMIANGSKCALIPDGGNIASYKVSYKDQTKAVNDDTHTTTYTKTIELTKNQASKDYTYKDILGGVAVNFGITADRFMFDGHMQTNFLTNYFDGNGDSDGVGASGFRPDLSDPNGGEIYIGHFGNFTDPEDRSAESFEEITEPQKNLISFDQISHPAHADDYYVKLYTPFDNSSDIYANNRDVTDGAAATSEYYVIREKMSSDEIAGIVGNAVAHIQAMSDELAGKAANLTPVLLDDKYVVDGTAYDEDVTLYIDADSMLSDEGALPTMLISLREGQNVVFNFKNAEKVNIGQFYIRTLVDGEWVAGPEPENGYGKTGENQTYHSDFNNWMDQYVMRNVVFNLNKATDVQVGGTAGLFIVNDPTSVTKMEGTTTGWMATAGFFSKGSGEWHFPYSELDELAPDDEETKTKVDLSKTNIAGDVEVTGAHIQLYKADESGDHSLFSEWDSDGTTKTFTLDNGDYYFVETAIENESADYEIVTSEICFSVEDGVVTVNTDQDALIENEQTGYVTYTEATETTNAKFTFKDAEKKQAEIVLSKTDITGDNEVIGATITITGDNGVAFTWVSGEEDNTFSLPDGNYVLKEEAVDNTQNELSYNIVTSEVSFTVAGGEIVADSIENISDGTQDGDRENGYVENNGNEFIFHDAEKTVTLTFSKMEIGGSEEISNAQLRITDESGLKIIKEWTSDHEAGPQSFELGDGTYILWETGDEFVYGDNTYKILESQVKFTIENGELTIDYDFSEGAFTESDNGYVVFDGDKTFTIYDAVADDEIHGDDSDSTSSTDATDSTDDSDESSDVDSDDSSDVDSDDSSDDSSDVDSDDSSDVDSDDSSDDSSDVDSDDSSDVDSDDSSDDSSDVDSDDSSDVDSDDSSDDSSDVDSDDSSDVDSDDSSDDSSDVDSDDSSDVDSDDSSDESSDVDSDDSSDVDSSEDSSEDEISGDDSDSTDSTDTPDSTDESSDSTADSTDSTESGDSTGSSDSSTESTESTESTDSKDSTESSESTESGESTDSTESKIDSDSSSKDSSSASSTSSKSDTDNANGSKTTTATQGGANPSTGMAASASLAALAAAAIVVSKKKRDDSDEK